MTTLATTEYRNCTIEDKVVHGETRSVGGDWGSFSGTLDLLRIDAALWVSDQSFYRLWEIQDGYGVPGEWPAQGYDWSGIRDSSQEAIKAMVEVATEYVSDDDLAAMLGFRSPLEVAYFKGEGCGGLDAEGVKRLVTLDRENSRQEGN